MRFHEGVTVSTRVEHDEGWIVELPYHFVDSELARLGHAAEHGRTTSVHVLHSGEIGRWFRLVTEDEVHEGLGRSFNSEPQCWIEFDLVTGRRAGHRAERFATRAA